MDKALSRYDKPLNL